MGKRIIQQARGKGSLTYRVRRKAFRFKPSYPKQNIEGEAEVLKLISSAGHTAPLAKLRIGNNIFYNLAFNGMYEGQKIKVGKSEEKEQGDIAKLGDLELGTKVYNIESRPGDGGKIIRTGGSSAVVSRKDKGKIIILMPSKKEKEFHPNCRATIGIIAGHGRTEKPIMKAGKQYYIKKAKSKLWPRTSAVCMNAIDHPMGSGRGKNPSHGKKGKIAKRNASPGAKVGLLRPKKTGRGKRRK